MVEGEGDSENRTHYALGADGGVEELVLDAAGDNSTEELIAYEIDPCASSPCENGATCGSFQGTYFDLLSTGRQADRPLCQVPAASIVAQPLVI